VGFFSSELAIIAYRGASAYEPENTLPAISKALELEADGVLVDVNATKDGVLIAFADDKVLIEGKEAYLGEIEYSVLREKVRVGKECYVPTLDEVVDLVKGKAKLIVIPKVEGLEESLINKLAEKGIINDVVVASRNIEVLRRFKDISRSIKLASIVSHPFPHVDNLRKQGVSFIMLPPGLIRGRIVKEAHTRGMEVIAWVVNDAATLSKVVNLGVDAVVTEKPDIKREFKHIIEKY